MADDCLNCARLEMLEALYATLLRDLIQLWDPAFPESPEDIFAAGGYLYHNLSEGDFIRAEAGLWCLINVANDPLYDCSANTTNQGGTEAQSRSALLASMCVIMAANDPGYDCTFTGLLSVAGTFPRRRMEFNRGCIIYMLMVWESLIAGTAPTLKTLTEAFAAGCCLTSLQPFWPTALLGGGAGGNPPEPGGNLPDPVIVADAVPSMRIALHSEQDAANDYEFGSIWTVTNSGTFTTGDAGSMAYMRTSAAALAVSGRETTQADWPADHSPIFSSFVYPEQLTDIRYFVGFTTNSLAAQLASRLPAGVYFGLIFDSAVDSFWTCVSSSGVGPPTTLVTSVAPSTSVRQIIRGDLDFGVDARFYIDGVRVGLIDTNLPPTGSMLRQANGFMNLNAGVPQYCGFLFEQVGSLKGGL